MGTIKCLELISLVAAGVLAGSEFMVCAGLRRPLSNLEQNSHIKFRQNLILRFRIMIPIIFFIAFSTGLVLEVYTASDSTSFYTRAIGEALLIAFIVLALVGTVPINKAVLTWNPSNPPKNWLGLIRRWENLDLARCLLAIAAFMSFAWALIGSH